MDSLAEFIQKKREKAGLSIIGLANKTNIKLETLEDIVNVRGVVQVYFNTDGNKSGKGLEKAEFQFD